MGRGSSSALSALPIGFQVGGVLDGELPNPSFSASAAQHILPRPSGGDDSERIQEWIDEAAEAGGGRVVLGPGTWLGESIVLKTRVFLDLNGATLKLIDGANADLLVTDQFDALMANDPNGHGGPHHFAVVNGTLDGNKANNSSGWPLRIFGRAYYIDKLEIKDGASGGVFSKWGTGGRNMEAEWSNFHVHECDGDGLDIQGPHDSTFVNGFVSKNNGDGIKTSGNAGGDQFTNVHVWGTEHTWAWYLGKRAYLANCQGEGALGNLLLGASGCTVVGGTFFGTSPSTSTVEVGIQFGDATHTGITHCNIAGVLMSKYGAESTPLNFYSSSGANYVQITLIPDAVTTVIGGTPAGSDHVHIRSTGTYAAEGTTVMSGRVVVNAPASTRGNTAFAVYDSSGTQLLNINANAKRLEYLNTAAARFYSGHFSGQTLEVSGDGYIEGAEISEPSAPVSNRGRLYFRDNGSSKTQLVCRFPTGAVQVIATEP